MSVRMFSPAGGIACSSTSLCPPLPHASHCRARDGAAFQHSCLTRYKRAILSRNQLLQPSLVACKALALDEVSGRLPSIIYSVSEGADNGLGRFFYEATQQVDLLVSSQLEGVTPVTYAVVLAAGLLTSLSPCTLSVLPLTIGYIGGYGSGAQQGTLGIQAASFSAGLATTLAALGIASTYLGRAYGQIGQGLPIAVSVVAVLMGLNLLQVLPLQLPSLDVDVRKVSVPPVAQAYLAGLTFALAASPCSTPVLATLLAYVSSTEDPVQGGALLLAYTSGYVAPLLVAATFTGVLKRLLALRQYSAWLTPASGVLLVTGGTYTLLSRLVPA